MGKDVKAENQRLRNQRLLQRHRNRNKPKPNKPNPNKPNNPKTNPPKSNPSNPSSSKPNPPKVKGKYIKKLGVLTVGCNQPFVLINQLDKKNKDDLNELLSYYKDKKKNILRKYSDRLARIHNELYHAKLKERLEHNRDYLLNQAKSRELTQLEMGKLNYINQSLLSRKFRGLRSVPVLSQLELDVTYEMNQKIWKIIDQMNMILRMITGKKL